MKKKSWLDKELGFWNYMKTNKSGRYCLLVICIVVIACFIYVVFPRSSDVAVVQDDFSEIIEKAENYTSDFNFLLDEADRELKLYRETGNETYLEIAKADIWIAMLVQLEYHEWYTYNLSKNDTLDPIDDYLWDDIYRNEDRLQLYLMLLYEPPKIEL